MAKTRKRGKRNRKNKNRENNNVQEPDQVRTCVSGDKLDRSCHLSPLHLVDIVPPTLTPSPNFQCTISDNKLLELSRSSSFRARSRSSIPKLHSSLIVECVKQKSAKSTPDTGLSRAASRIKFNFNDSFNDYKTPMKRMRSNSMINALTPPIIQPSKRTKSTPNNDDDKNTSNEQSFFTPQLLNKFSTPLPKISPIHNSTPKTSQRKKSVIIEQEDEEQQFCRRRSSSNTPPRNLSVIQALSPILKNSVEEKKFDIKTLKQVGFLTPTKKVIGKFRRLGFRPPFSLVDLYNWLGLAMKKGFTTIKRMCYRTISDQSTSIKDSCRCNDYKNQITQLNTKIDELTAELQNVKEELRTFDDLKNEFKEFKQQILSSRLNPISSLPCAAPPPPPPLPPPPPPPLPMISISGPTPTSRPMKTAVRKLDKQTADNSRPAITVDDILKVRLRKTTAAVPILRKPPNRPPNEVFKQVKLRPPSRSNTPQMLGSSPKSSLARILKNVDTNVRTVRRIKKAQFLSYDDISRHQSFRQRTTTGNDSAPVMS